MRSRTAGVLLAGGLLAGSTGLVLSSNGLISATAPPDDTVVEDEDVEDEDVEDEGVEDEDGRFRVELGGPIQQLVEALVESGALTQEQADSILELVPGDLPEIIIAERDVFEFPDRRRDRHHVPGFPELPPGDLIFDLFEGFDLFGVPLRPGDHFFGFGGMLHGLDVVADTIGIEMSELRQELRSGATIAEIAGANGVDPQSVVDALVAEAEAHIFDIVFGAGGDDVEPAEEETEEVEDADEVTDTTEATDA